MINRPSGFSLGTIAFVGIVAVCVLFFFLGAFEAIRGVIDAIRNSHPEAPIIAAGGGILALISTSDANGFHLVPDRANAFLTALFTALLVWVTYNVGRASRRQAALDGPLLKIDLVLPPVGTATAGNYQKRNVGAYGTSLQVEDERLFTSPEFRALTPQRFVLLRVENVQEKTFAVARDIEISLRLVYRDTAATPRRERVGLQEPLEREHFIRILAPGQSDWTPVFNSAPLNQFSVGVIKVRYKDLGPRRKRRAAHGMMTLRVDSAGNLSRIPGYSRAKGWELP